MHGITYDSDDYCPLSLQPTPVTGYDDKDYERRASTVVSLAAELRDQDPKIVYSYLRSQTHAELVQLAAVALAAINTDQTIRDIYRWVIELPEARFA